MRLLQSVICAVVLGTAHLHTANGSTVKVSLSVDNPELSLLDDSLDSTTLHVWAEVVDGVPSNGIYAYALNVLESNGSVIRMDAATLLGDPMPSFSNSGSPMFDGLHDIYGGDGGYFLDKNRGIGDPYELLTIPIQALEVGEVTLFPTIADQAAFFGIPDGFLLQQPGAVAVDFGPGALVRVIPEPSSLILLCVASAVLIRRSRNGRARGHESLKDGCCAELRPMSPRSAAGRPTASLSRST